jgi:hypothetical protein
MTLKVSLLRPRMSAAELYLHSDDLSRYFYTLFFTAHFNNIPSHTPLLCLQPFGYFDDTP